MEIATGMILSMHRNFIALTVGAFGLAACRATPQTAPAPETSTAVSTVQAPPPGAAAAEAIAKARADSALTKHVQADVDFMSGMIGHHAQAIVMSQWAPTHGASPEVQRLAARIINAQNDEIHIMQAWLAQRGLPVPEAKAAPMMMTMADGTKHEMLMPGMLTEQQMAQLDSARGKEFDRLFLTDMIQHHRGAISMVKDWMDSYGAGQDELVFKMASDINVDQTTEVARMQRMLASLVLGVDVP